GSAKSIATARPSPCGDSQPARSSPSSDPGISPRAIMSDSVPNPRPLIPNPRQSLSIIPNPSTLCYRVLMPQQPPALHARAMDEIRFIRSTMERAGRFTAVPGWGGVAMGLSALVAAAAAGPPGAGGRWLFVWLGDAVFAAIVAFVAIVRKAKR